LGTSEGVGAQLPVQDWPAQPGRVGGDLTPLEAEMVAAAAGGELVDWGEGLFGLAEMRAWGQERTIRAAVLRHLLVAEQWPVHPKGVRLRGVRISGNLDLEAAALRCPLALDCCYLDADIPACLDHAKAQRVTLTRCQLPGVTGEMLTASKLDLSGSTVTYPLRLTGAEIIGQLICRGAQLTGADSNGDSLVAEGMRVGSVLLTSGFTAAGAIRLTGAEITSQLDCSGAQLTGTDSYGYALHAERAKAGSVVLTGGFTAAGAVRLTAMEITSQLNCSSAQLTGTDSRGNALHADGIKAGSVLLTSGFTAAGAVRLPGAEITGHLNCSSAQLTGTDSDGDALVADGMQADSVLLTSGFTAAGAVRLPGARITSQLACRGAQLTDTDSDGNTLVADGMKVGEDVFLDGGFTAAGKVSLNSTHVGGSVLLAPARLAPDDRVALDAARAQISGSLVWAPSAPVSGQVNLEGAAVGQLEDNWGRNRPNGYWPADGRLHLDGFTYGRFGGGRQATVEQRLAWIRSQYQPRAGHSPAHFATQPYEQLAIVYRQSGQDGQARKVAIARRADLRTYGNLNPYRWFGNWFLDWTIKYGYQTWRAGVGLAAVFVVFLVLSILGQHHHVIVPIGEIDGLHSVPSATQCTSEYPCFYPVGYTVDTVIPIINVRQADYWGPDGNAPWGWVWVGGTWIATGLGWALATLLVAGYTGLVRQD
jgi:hypothetical protein